MTTEENTAVEKETPTEKAETPAAPAEKTAEKGRGDQRGGGRGPRRGGRSRKPREPKEFEESILQIDRVTRVTKGGRQLRFRVSVVIGDQKGRVGFGVGKSSEVMTGVQKAIAQAKRNLINVPIFEDTIPHAVNAKFKSSKVLLFPAPEGKGVIAGGAVRKVLELAGVKNVLSKMHGSRNKLNSAYATIQALTDLQNRAPHKAKATIEAEKAEKAAAHSEAEKTDSKEVSKASSDKKPAAKKPVAKKTTAKKKDS